MMIIEYQIVVFRSIIDGTLLYNPMYRKIWLGFLIGSWTCIDSLYQTSFEDAEKSIDMHWLQYLRKSKILRRV